MADVLGGTELTTTEVSPRAVPQRASGVELLGSIRGSGYRRPPCLVRRGDGQTVQLTPLLYSVLDVIDGHRDLDGIAAAASERTGKRAEIDDVAYLIDQKLRPLGVLKATDGTDPHVERVNPLLGLRFKFVISNPEVTRRVTRPFAALFHW
jgi:putative peptide zinc metalloprotease protein